MIYLLRHADAVADEDDDARVLSPEGRRQVRRLAAFLSSGDKTPPEEVWHSPLVRARQTAALLAKSLEWGAPFREVSGLRSEDDPRLLAARLQSADGIALVGHEPHLSSLASLLVTGAVAPPILFMEKCALLALERTGGTGPGCWTVRWHIAPELLGP